MMKLCYYIEYCLNMFVLSQVEAGFSVCNKLLLLQPRPFCLYTPTNAWTLWHLGARPGLVQCTTVSLAVPHSAIISHPWSTKWSSLHLRLDIGWEESSVYWIFHLVPWISCCVHWSAVD